MSLSVWRLEPGGAEGQLESMAAGNTMMVPPTAEEAQVQSHVVLHNSNCKRSGVGRASQDERVAVLLPTGSPAAYLARPLHRLPVNLRDITFAKLEGSCQFSTLLPVAGFLRQHELIQLSLIHI